MEHSPYGPIDPIALFASLSNDPPSLNYLFHSTPAPQVQPSNLPNVATSPVTSRPENVENQPSGSRLGEYLDAIPGSINTAPPGHLVPPNGLTDFRTDFDRHTRGTHVEAHQAPVSDNRQMKEVAHTELPRIIPYQQVPSIDSHLHDPSAKRPKFNLPSPGALHRPGRVLVETSSDYLPIQSGVNIPLEENLGLRFNAGTLGGDTFGGASTSHTRVNEYQNGNLPEMSMVPDSGTMPQMAQKAEIESSVESVAVFNYQNHLPFSIWANQVGILRFDREAFHRQYVSPQHQSNADSIISLIESLPHKSLLISNSTPNDAHETFCKLSRSASGGGIFQLIYGAKLGRDRAQHLLKITGRKKMMEHSWDVLRLNKNVWFKFWGERTGIKFADIERKMLPKSHSHFFLFIFYIDMLGTIIQNNRGVESYETQDNSSSLIKLAVEQFQRDHRMSFLRPGTRRRRILISFTTSSQKRKKYRTQSERMCNSKQVWDSIQKLIDGLDDQYLHSILHKKGKFSVAGKTFFNDIFCYSISNLSQRLANHYRIKEQLSKK
ncbi:hypothetical protein PGTUg99_009938 [Puccinia graminis f. sp. tritici]|uniref:Uncharacterized protein n=1 Tax=Puccinia graminis f. sp. tritici TaxID=56615 RepID=A0A5B0NBH7_PUCGR|nr:hypothetical protein PGTUg99_009938 [Puccinia graminis f. sp. tritici]